MAGPFGRFTAYTAVLRRPCRAARAAAPGAPRRVHRSAPVAMAQPWRPTPDDVDRLSRGEGATKRGTGNSNIPHRLSAEERPVFESSKKKGYLAVRGTGARKAHARHGHPLPNSWRQHCDARGLPCVVIEQDRSGGGEDTVVVDLAPLRLLDCSEVSERCRELARRLGLRQLLPEERGTEDVPFDVAPVRMPGAAAPQPQKQQQQQQQQQLRGHEENGGQGPEPAAAAGDGGGGGSGGGDGAARELAAAAAAVEAQAGLVRALKERGGTNQSPEVQAGVQTLLKLKAHLAALQGGEQQQQPQQDEDEDEEQQQQQVQEGEGDGEESSAGPATEGAEAAAGEAPEAAGAAWGLARRRQVLPDAHPYAKNAIWQLPPRPLFFEGARAEAKEFAKALAAEAAGGAARR
ncbi:hypothetical protein Rsub_05397 [Raphidocelis subcapitata]|uniref:WHEP-TRS domain-containing protein n=1 Tax=Raphidocelis subcapitata TaxID=307507 RepID=A0A2V0NYR0_9CHLO|nr:hypothetical protein Rsub_05397 [Raphidocelis subcapitata]|eukprot:GBF92778.1 hypothetical protein Rsub_05397 [Raphidocelis subcapitata]